MYIARILYPVKVLGPGRRVGIWFSGCEHGCPGCSNPELWQKHERYAVEAETVLSLVRQVCESHPVDGFTLTGGDPFYQPEALARLLPELAALCGDILVYTGYDYESVRARYPELMQWITVLIDGRYIQERNRGEALRGSDNQRILVLDKSREAVYRAYLDGATNEIQDFATRDGVVSVGIHRPGYEAELDARLKGKGLRHE